MIYLNISEVDPLHLALAILYLVLGLVLAVCYLILPLPEGEEQPIEAEGDDLRLEYETFNSEVARRGEAFIISGTIFVTLSFLILAQASSHEITCCHRIVLAYTSLAIYSIWLFLFGYTARRLDKLSYTRIHSIEKKLKIRVHRYVDEATRNTLWIAFRRSFWAIVLVALSVTGFFILLS